MTLRVGVGRVGVVRHRVTDRTRQIAKTLADYEVVESDAPLKADALFWAEPARREQPYPAHTVNIADLAFWPGTLTGAARRAAWRDAQTAACRGADVALVGSEAEFGFWSAEFARAGVNTPLLVCAPGSLKPGAPVTSLSNLVLVLERETTDAVLDGVQEAASWAAGYDGQLHVFAAQPGGLRGLTVMRRLRQMGGPVVVLAEVQAVTPGLFLDFREDTADERVRTPPAVMHALRSGWPVLSTVAGALTQRIVSAGAGIHAGDSVTAALTEIATLDLQQLSQAARRISEIQADTLSPWLQNALARRGEHAGRPLRPLGPNAHVLVISNDHENLIDIRVHRPFGAMHRQGMIAGYAVMRHGEIAFSTRPAGRHDPDLAFDALWIHRADDPQVHLLVQALGRPFAYDLDDNLLAAPEYRERFGRGANETVRALLGGCAVLSGSTARLIMLLQRASGVRLADRAVVTPNLALAQPSPATPGPPRAVVWASSDTPALTGTRETVEQAVRDFCAAHRLRLICMGAPPSAALREAGLDIEHIGILPYGAYLDFLRALAPAILVCPLDTHAAPATQDFIDGKSDVKMIDAAATGLVGVFSDAQPYRDSDLGPHILCENSHEGWIDGMERAYRACCQPEAPVQIPQSRMAAAAGLAPWAEALSRARLNIPLYRSEVKSALDYIAQRRRRFLKEQEFDTTYYLETHIDVQSAVTEGMLASAYDHYQSSGYTEGRDARPRADALSDTRAWWAQLLQTVDHVERATTARARQIEELAEAKAARRALRS